MRKAAFPALTLAVLATAVAACAISVEQAPQGNDWTHIGNFGHDEFRNDTEIFLDKQSLVATGGTEVSEAAGDIDYTEQFVLVLYNDAGGCGPPIYEAVLAEENGLRIPVVESDNRGGCPANSVAAFTAFVVDRSLLPDAEVVTIVREDRIELGDETIDVPE